GHVYLDRTSRVFAPLIFLRGSDTTLTEEMHDVARPCIFRKLNTRNRPSPIEWPSILNAASPIRLPNPRAVPPEGRVSSISTYGTRAAVVLSTRKAWTAPFSLSLSRISIAVSTASDSRPTGTRLYEVTTPRPRRRAR